MFLRTNLQLSSPFVFAIHLIFIIIVFNEWFLYFFSFVQVLTVMY